MTDSVIRKAVILAGGLGTRLAEETAIKPKPMVEIGGRPMLWHIMQAYSRFGINEFVICLGYKGYVIKEYFSNFFLHGSDVTFDLANNKTTVHNNTCDPWLVTLVDTGAETQTGGRLKRVKNYLYEGEDFCFTYGDGVSDVDIAKLIAFHQEQREMGVLATVTAVQPPGRFGALDIQGDKVHRFEEKPRGDSYWINGGFFVCAPEVIDYIDNDFTRWENEPLETMAAEGRLCAYRHDGFWQCMDTLRDKQLLDKLWDSGRPPWMDINACSPG